MKVHKKLGEILVEAKKISKEQLRRALTDQSANGGKIGEHLLALGFIDEESLYGALSKQLKIPMIPEEKFQRLKVIPKTLEMIPHHFASKNWVFPIQFDAERSSVSVAMVDPTDSEVVKEIKVLCQVETVKRYLAQKSSILKAIDRYYAQGALHAPESAGEDTSAGFQQRASVPKDEITSPSSIARPQPAKKSPLGREDSVSELTENTIVNPELAAEMIAKELMENETSYSVASPATGSVKIDLPPMREETNSAASLGRIALKKQVPEAPSFKIAPSALVPRETENTPLPVRSTSPGTPAPTTSAAHAKAALAEHRILLVDDHAPSANTAEKLLLSAGYHVTLSSTAQDALQALKHSAFDLILLKSSFSMHLTQMRATAQLRNANVQVRPFSTVAQSILGSPIDYDALMESFQTTVDYLVSLLEHKNPAQRRAAHTIAKYSRLVAQRLNLSRLAVDEIYFAAYLHDLWKLFAETMPEEGEEGEQRRSLVDFFSDQNCPLQIVPIIKHLEEFFNGAGKPDGLKGGAIPVGSRIISVVRAFEEMLRSKLIKDHAELAKVSKLLRKGAEKKFDPECVEAFVQVLEAESFLETAGIAPVVENKNEVLLVDKDPQATSLIELRLINEGFSVKVARDGQEAWRLIQESPPTLIISDVVLPKIDGFNLCEMVKSNPQYKHISFIFASSRKDDFNMTKGLEMGADDYQTKPVNVPFLITKVRKLLEAAAPATASAPAASAAAGVNGNLAQMGLVEIIQILGGGNKTAFLDLQNPKGTAAKLYMERGRIVSASCGVKNGEEAFYEMMTWSEGRFSILADKTTAEKNINNSNDFLLLEAMRRMDEANSERTNA